MSEIEYKLVEELIGNGYETFIEYHEDGSIWYQEWYLNNKLHRENRPAAIGYYEDGSIWYQYWYLNDKRHRIDGPAVIHYYDYYEDGSIDSQEWYLKDKRLYKKDFTSFEMVEKMQAHSLFTLKELLQLKRRI